jgi:hypothetical protein
MEKMKETKRRGAPPKVGGGAKRGAFIRFDDALVELLDERVQRYRSSHRGRAISRAEVIRELLYEGLEKEI